MKETGGPAFPQAVMNDEGEIYYFHDWHGMSLRDYFAAKAMQTLLRSPMHYVDVAAHAYEMADKMLEARK
jgi:hypothetical protein